MAKSTFVYVTYIRTAPEKLWAVLTDAEAFREYWFGMRMESDWTKGSPWKMVASDGTVYDTGEIAEAAPPRRLLLRWQHQLKPELKAEGPSLCTIDLEPSDGAVKLSITHSIDKDGSKFLEAVAIGWPKVASNIKSLLETGAIALPELRY